jgi:hypothetical protein
MGRRAKERYWRFFTADKMAQSYFDLYSDLVNITTTTIDKEA